MRLMRCIMKTEAGRTILDVILSAHTRIRTRALATGVRGVTRRRVRAFLRAINQRCLVKLSTRAIPRVNTLAVHNAARSTEAIKLGSLSLSLSLSLYLSIHLHSCIRGVTSERGHVFPILTLHCTRPHEMRPTTSSSGHTDTAD